jgi:hypothetical protein
MIAFCKGRFAAGAAIDKVQAWLRNQAIETRMKSGLRIA